MSINIEELITRFPLAALSPPEERRIRKTGDSEAMVISNPKICFDQAKYCMVKFGDQEKPAWVVGVSKDSVGNNLYILKDGIIIPENRLVGLINVVIIEKGKL